MTDKVEPKEESPKKSKDKKMKSEKKKRPKLTYMQKIKKYLNTKRMRLVKRGYLAQMGVSTFISLLLYAPGYLGIANSKTTGDPYISEFKIDFDQFSSYIMFS